MALTQRQQQRQQFLKTQGRDPATFNKRANGPGAVITNTGAITPVTGAPVPGTSPGSQIVANLGQGPTGQGPAGLKGTGINRALRKAGYDKETRQDLKQEFLNADYAARKGAQYGNPDQVGPFGGVTRGYGPDGQLIETQYIDEKQQAIIDRETALRTSGLEKGQGFLGNIGEFSFDGTAERQKIEDAQYAKQTRDLDENYGKQRTALEQELANKGYSVQSPFVQQKLKDFDADYGPNGRLRQEARNSASEFAGNELTRSFGIASGTQNQKLGDVANITNLGPGARLPNVQPYQSPGYEIASGAGVTQGSRNIKNQKYIAELTSRTQKEIAALNAKTQKEIAAMSGGGGGGESSGGQTGRFPVD